MTERHTLTPGSHDGSLVQNCIMEHVALRHLREQGVIDTKILLEYKTDSPGCTASWIVAAAQRVNDVVLRPEGRTKAQLAENERLLLALSDRLLYEARVPADLEKRKRVAVRVACWAARSVLPLVENRDREASVAAIEAAEGWLAGTVTIEEVAKAREGAAAATAAYAAAATATTAAAYAATTTTTTAAYATAAYATATAAYATEHDREAIMFLDGLLDAHVKALAEEGLLGDEDAFEVWAIESCPV